MSSCDWISNGAQCEFPGTMSDSILGGGRWLCPHHNRCDDQETGAEIVQRSHRWAALPNRAEAWVESRRASVYAGDSPVVTRLREQIGAYLQGRRTGIAASRLSSPARNPGGDEAAA